MSKVYSAVEAKTKLMNELEDALALKKAWEEVTFPTKKDGTAFKQFDRNINGATITYPYNGASIYQKTLQVHTHGSSYCCDSILLYEYVSCLKKESQKNKPQNRVQSRYSGTNDVYAFDIEDTKEAVYDRIVYFNEYIKDLQYEIEICEDMYNKYKKAYEDLEKQLKKDCTPEGSMYSSLAYMLHETFCR